MRSPTEVLSARLLIVDDQESNLRLLEFTLRRAGYVAVTSTSDAAGVVALHQENHYDLILLDVRMPGMNGFEVMAQLRALENDRVGILVLTADHSQSPRAMAAGADGFLGKPFVLKEVVGRVGALLRAGGASLPGHAVAWQGDPVDTD